MNGVERKLWLEYRVSPTTENRNKLVEQYQPIVAVHAAKLVRTMPYGVTVDDLISGGQDGLIRAVERFDVAQNTKFTTFASKHIRGAMLDWTRGQDHLSRSSRRHSKRMARIEQQVWQETGQPPTDEAIAQHLGVGVERVQRMRHSMSFPDVLSYHHGVTAKAGAPSHIELLEDDTCGQPGIEMQRRSTVEWLLRCLTKREAMVVRMYYLEGYTLKQVGEKSHRSESWASIVHRQAMNKLRQIGNRVRE